MDSKELAMQTTMSFPTSLSEKYRPTTFDAFVGLDKVKRVLSKFALAPFATSFLFVGASGTGKTSAALALAQAINGELHHIPSQNCTVANLEDVCRVCHYIPQAGANGWHVVLADEIDSASPAAQLALLSKLDGTATPPQTIFVFTANATDKLQDRLLSRCVTLEFSSHGMSTGIAALLERVWKSETDAPCPNFDRLVKNAGNNCRDALNNLTVELLAV
jgi:replication-associated recombination protein RarA